ncbi:hypothetical protein PoB_006859800 [Plakobranchus ocellatus]|uniref:Uncharacterized protein n=1 Tax=Plakobranchus ocellatus TaxID=259542 RepID=A0AAV4DCY9_9GAST|nr:hypothetical protein PoB_006859800 [Plakobranchus ocellatus]
MRRALALSYYSDFSISTITTNTALDCAVDCLEQRLHDPARQLLGSVERANGAVKDILVARMADNDLEDWPTGIDFASRKDGEKKSGRSASWRTRC